MNRRPDRPRKLRTAYAAVALLLVFATLPSLAGLTVPAAGEPGFTLNVCHPLDGWTVAPAIPAVMRSVPFFRDSLASRSEPILIFICPRIAGPSLTPPVPPPEPRG
ncbi:MAG: hypothetical protein ACREQB_09610 [Candidatus Binataceae bacterium]